MDYGSGNDEIRELTQKEIDDMKVRRDDDYKPRKKKIDTIKLEKEFEQFKNEMDNNKENNKDLYKYNDNCIKLPKWSSKKKESNDVKRIKLTKRNNIRNIGIDGMGIQSQLSQRIQSEMDGFVGM